MELITINEKTCNKDGICAAVCPGGLIDFEKGEIPVPIDKADEVCIRCGHCVAVCPTGSLSHKDMNKEDCPDVKKEFDLGQDQCEHFLRGRRSIRVYKDKPVERNLINDLIEIARYAPSGHNCQCAEWTVIEDRKELDRLSGVIAEWMSWMLEHMKEVALSINLDRALERWESGIDNILRGAPTVIVAHAQEDNRLAQSTCTLALCYLDLAARSMGLGSCWAGYFNSAAMTFPPMKEALALPEGQQSFGAMMLGYPKFKYHRLPTRNIPKITWR